MTTVLVSTVELEDTIHTALTESVGSCYTNVPGSIVKAMVGHYNYQESDCLLDTIVGHPDFKSDEYTSAEAFADLFVRLVESNADMSKQRVTLEYCQRDSTIIVTILDRKQKSKTSALMEEYHHAREQWDFYPERLLRAFGEIESLLR